MTSVSENEINLLLFTAANAANIPQIKKLVEAGADVNTQFHCYSNCKKFFYSSISLIGFLIERAYCSFSLVHVNIYCGEHVDYILKPVLCQQIGNKLVEVVDCLIKLGAKTNGTILSRTDYYDFNRSMTFVKRICFFLQKESFSYISYSTQFSRTQLCFDLLLTILQSQTCDDKIETNCIDFVNDICVFYVCEKMSKQYEALFLNLIHYLVMFGFPSPSANFSDNSYNWFRNTRKPKRREEEKLEKIFELAHLKNYSNNNLYFGGMTFTKLVWFIYCLKRKNIYFSFY